MIHISLEEREVTIKKYVPTIRLKSIEFDALHQFYHDTLGEHGKFAGTYIDKIKICGNLGELECFIEIED